MQITLQHTTALLEEAGFEVRVAEMHPHGEWLCAEFHAPRFDAAGNIRRVELSEQLRYWQAERDLLGLGVVVALKRLGDNSVSELGVCEALKYERQTKHGNGAPRMRIGGLRSLLSSPNIRP